MLVAIVACGEGPQPRDLAPSDGRVVTEATPDPATAPGVPVSREVPSTSQSFEWFDSAAWASPATRIGAESGAPAETFGRIRDIAISDSGDVVILDDMAHTIHWFTPDGTWRGSAGRSGGGPGEFRAPMGIELDDAGRVLVADMAHRRITRYRREVGGLVLDTMYSTPIFMLDFCVLHDRLYVLASRDGNLIHELDDSGEIINSFAPPLHEIRPELAQHASILAESYTRGRLRCIEPDRIAVVHDQLPDVRMFAADGALLWATRLADYRQVNWQLTTDGRGLSMAADPQTGTAHTVRYTALIDNETLAVTLNETGLTNLEGSLTVRLFRMADGHEMGVRPVPAILVGVRNGSWYGVQDHPWPAVLIARHH